MNIKNRKKEFMHREICSLCFIASLGMARKIPFYKNNKINREPIKKYLRDELWKLSIKYSQKIKGNNHIKTIEDFKNQANKKFSGKLAGSGFTFGRAQKLVNLYLKYMWVCEYIKEPPHCPIDSSIIKKLGRELHKLSFLKMNKDEYKKVISKIEKKKGNQSIAEWELNIFNSTIINRKK
ncbi:MAG: hypothetical protein A3I89_00215 [Candidatus Harrisonbacteria bacterium RIFCSPLOWO2_02_FULL_41_11]|uniref:Uncharacterized protein n=1 Tax=Candidatus Harrisonbacteria bacterium RIFCSPHIGHO2_02_FULL_42_16 TaxID=1798404 RepID=A0A1G1ZHJ1_9BACT|nr:MAG: hypothetical protein A3B92_03170 [Candidatus Harrisonbacteria bacterium RIFCSPHIGHO2_02_FULL_42_16]OGY65783.1 MAG: hypothetical protein A3I89_00215 [Candidatus Harrisonbacteria bacterium RIFCSPLOWO2_02_FULL_41_11]